MRSPLLLCAFVVTAGCGGSSSETPWPVEPDQRALGPAGENSPINTTEDKTPESRGEVSPTARATESADPKPPAPPPKKKP